MAKKDVHEKRFVWVKDKAGNEYVCRIDDLKDPKKVLRMTSRTALMMPPERST